MSNELAFARKIDTALRELDKIPLHGNAPRFDVQEISSKVSQEWSAPSLSLEMGECCWRTGKEIKKGLGSNVMSLEISLSPLAGEIGWLMDRADVARLTSFLMNGKTRHPISSEILQEGFYRYLATKALDALQGLEPLKGFTLKINDDGESTIDNAYCIDVELSVDKLSCWGRLVLSSHFMSAWQRHFASMRELFSLSSMAKDLEVPVSICTGHVLLTTKEWNKLEKGDFVLLDRGGYDPRHHEGTATLMLGKSDLFHVSIKENKIKLLDYATFYEEMMEKTEIPMAEEGRAMAVKELPLQVTVELARLKMTVDQLMKLSPGNFLELPIRPEQEVTLTVNGQKIGRAELVHLGEALGIRIIETA